ncbi:hypothetical protein GQ53DRAFT_821592 [Thozetella sp. PMI_491]|nr:hypothetical protein GQ53DRAFT_821592 [Thozetella sp. PMI_491]
MPHDSNNCLLVQRNCEYTQVESWAELDANSYLLESEDQQGSFGFWQLAKDPRMVDPFDSLPSGTPPKARELLYHLIHAQERQCQMPLSKKHIKRAIQHPDDFRGVVLLAALHFRWSTGDLGDFESTYVTTKIECIRTVNRLLGCPKEDHDAIRSRFSLVATLCLVESCSRNLAAAETHLEGLLVLLENEKLAWPTDRAFRDANNVISRYLLLCMDQVRNLRQCLTGSSVGLAEEAQLGPGWQSLCTNELLSDFNDRLLAFWLMPSLLYADLALRADDVDALDFVDVLRVATANRGGCRPSHARATSFSAVQPDSRGTTMSNYFLWGLSGSGVAPQSTGGRGGVFLSSWASLSVATRLYNAIVLQLKPYWCSPHSRTMIWLLQTLQQDLEDTFEISVVERRRSSDFWFWKAFLGTAVLVEAWCSGAVNDTAEVKVLGGKAMLLELMSWFCHKVRLWSIATGTAEWEDAKDSLGQVVWPVRAPTEALFVAVWDRALATEAENT